MKKNVKVKYLTKREQRKEEKRFETGKYDIYNIMKKYDKKR